jgi:hypothetical protein
LKVNRDLKAIPGLKVRKDRKVTPEDQRVHKGPKVSKAQLDHLDRRDHRGLLDPRAIKATQGTRVPRGLPVLKDHKELLDLKDFKVPKVIRVIQDYRVHRGLRDHKGPKVIQGHRVHKDPKVTPVTQAPKVCKGLQVPRGLKELLDLKVRRGILIGD